MRATDCGFRGMCLARTTIGQARRRIRYEEALWTSLVGSLACGHPADAPLQDWEADAVVPPQLAAAVAVDGGCPRRPARRLPGLEGNGSAAAESPSAGTGVTMKSASFRGGGPITLSGASRCGRARGRRERVR